MKKEDYKITIVGAGLSGLAAATVLENRGYAPVILEASNTIGGRLATDVVEGYQLDRGFQVMLTAYPKVSQYLDLKNLMLQELRSGAVIYDANGEQRIGDPLRDIGALWPTIVSNIGSFSDKFKVLKLNIDLKKKSIDAIFASEEKTTLEYLREKSFSEKIIDKFFRPFFMGIFLEPDLRTSSRMFEFVYKMFGKGKAVIPKDGIGAITKQMAEKLNRTDIRFNTAVKQVIDGKIILENGENLESHFTIVATEASDLIANLKNQQIQWKSCHTFYFEAEKRSLDIPVIGLISEKEALINNFFWHTSIATTSKGKGELLSVTVVKETDLNLEALKNRVEVELDKYCQIKKLRFLKHYEIKKGLPDISQLQYELLPTETRLTNTIFLAGDQLLNGSQNAALLSGERAALGLLETLEGGAITGQLTSEYL